MEIKIHIAILRSEPNQDVYFNENTHDVLIDIYKHNTIVEQRKVGKAENIHDAEILINTLFENVELD